VGEGGKGWEGVTRLVKGLGKLVTINWEGGAMGGGTGGAINGVVVEGNIQGVNNGGTNQRFVTEVTKLISCGSVTVNKDIK
jgi:hypothetical protein